MRVIWRPPCAGCGPAARPFGRPHPQLPVPSEMKSPPGGLGVAAGSWSFPDPCVGAATSLSLSRSPLWGPRGGSRRKEGRPEDAILLLGSSPFSRGVLGWRPLRPVAGVCRGGASAVAGRGSNPRKWVSPVPEREGLGGRPWASCPLVRGEVACLVDPEPFLRGPSPRPSGPCRWGAARRWGHPRGPTLGFGSLLEVLPQRRLLC